MQAIHAFFSQKDFIQIDAPTLTPISCEDSTSMFPVKFFDNNCVYLSQSGQLYMEAAAASFGKVYCVNPVFRAEKSSTRRHLLEFWMVEPEMAFHDLDQCMQLAEELIEHIVLQVLKNRQQEMEFLQRDLEPLRKIRTPFPRLSYKEAIDILKKHKSTHSLKNTQDHPHQTHSSVTEKETLGGEDETVLSSLFEKPVFIHRYPVKAKAFYMKTDQNDPHASLSFDLLGTQGYGEIIGGSQREDDLEILEQKMRDHHVEKKDLEWYLDLRRYGGFPHSGFGLGVERGLSWICELDHVRESIAFPRLYGRKFF